MKIHKIENWEYWYDRSVGVWYASETDDHGNLIGESLNAYNKEDIILYVKRELYGETAELLERLVDHDISKEAKKAIVEELKASHAEVMKCVFVGEKPENFRNDFTANETYVVLRKTKTTVTVWSGITDVKFILSSDGEYKESGWTDDRYRSVLIPTS